jgi:hypothetical protein
LRAKVFGSSYKIVNHILHRSSIYGLRTIDWKVAMRRVARILTLGSSAPVILIAALVTQPTPAAAHPICGDTPVVVSGTFWDRSNAWGLARPRWSHCTRRVYGEGWTHWRHGDAKVICHDAGMDYQIDVTCPHWDNNRKWVCYFMATPCRWRWRGRR